MRSPLAKHALSAVLALVACAASLGVEIKLPPEVKVQPGRLAKIDVETTGKVVKWRVCTPGADLQPSETGRFASFAAPKPGKYEVIAWTAEGDAPSDAAVCVVTVADDVPPPVNALTKKLQEAFDKETNPKKQDLLAGFLSVLQEVPKQIDKAQTFEQLRLSVTDATNAVVGKGVLQGVRSEVGAYLNANLPEADGQLTDASRASIAAVYARVSEALSKVK